MKVSFWQQFSSNHSAHYTVVGSFATAQDAQRAADELRKILRTIEQWWQQPPPQQEIGWLEHVELGRLTPIEEKLAEQYGVEWTHGINWFGWASWDHQQLPVHVYERCAFVSSPHWYLWFGPQPFNQLLKVWGADVSVATDECRTYPNTTLLLDATGTLPDESTAQALYNRFTKAFNAALAEAQNDYEHYDSKAIDALGYLFNYDLIDDPFEPPERLFEVECDGNMLSLYGLNIVEQYGLPEALEHFLAYLRGLGCTDIQYRFHSALVPRKRYSAGDE